MCSLIVGVILFFYHIASAESPDIGDLQVFPSDNAWNWDISTYEVHPNSDNFIASIGGDETLHPDFGTVWAGAPIGIPYVVVDNSQPMIEIVFTAYGDESDPGPYPIPLTAPVEGGPDSDGDRHVLAVDIENAMLYELYRAFPGGDRWEAGCGALYDLTSNDLRPEGWTSADAAGLPIFPGLVRYEEVYIQQEIDHALRFTVQNSQRKYIWPARHYASTSTDPNRPPMGLRLRLKADFVHTGFSEPVQVILCALKKYGMFVADNGSDWYISGAPDERWDDDVLGELKTIEGSNFEVVRTVDDNGNPIYPPAEIIPHRNVYRVPLALSRYSNPFYPSLGAMIVTYFLYEDNNVKVNIYTCTGTLIKTLERKVHRTGIHTIHWHGTDEKDCVVPSGSYLLQILAGGHQIRRTIILLK